MLRLIIARRLLGGVLLVFVVTLVIFVATNILPGDAANYVLGRYATPESLAVVREQLELDQPAAERYVKWLAGAVHGDLGTSLTIRESVGAYLSDRSRNTLVLAGVTLMFMIPLSLVLGAVAAVRRDGIFDRVMTNTSLVLTALPEFVVAIVLVGLFAVQWQLLPAVATIASGGSVEDWAKTLTLPVVTLLAVSIAQTARMVRGSMIEVLDSEFIEAIRLRGIPERRVIWRHAVPNSLGPFVQVVALNAAWLVGGVVIVETVFAYPGLGQALVSAAQSHDVPVMQAIGALLAVTYVLLNLFADVTAILLTPRLRDEQ